MAYLRDIYRPTCLACGRPATVELFNQQNSSLGTFCKSCGKTRLNRVQQEEERWYQGLEERGRVGE